MSNAAMKSIHIYTEIRGTPNHLKPRDLIKIVSPAYKSVVAMLSFPFNSDQRYPSILTPLTYYTTRNSSANPNDPHSYICHENQRKKPPSTAKQEGKRNVHVHHTTPQTRLQRLWIPPEQPHDTGPTDSRKDRPRIRPDLIPYLPTHHTFTLHQQLCKSKHDPPKDVYHNLLTDRRLYPAPKHNIPSHQAREERFVRGFFRREQWLQVPRREHDSLVDEREEGEVARVLPGSF